MPDQTKTPVANLALPPDPYPEYRPIYAWLFQAWLMMFLIVICVALIFYLMSYIRF